MTQQLDKSVIKDSITKAKSGEILHLTSNAADPQLLKGAVSEVQKFISKGVCIVTCVRMS